MNAAQAPDDTPEPGVKTPPITICNSSSRLAYTGGPGAAPARERADNALAIPSRVGNRLHYRCGRVAELTPNDLGNRRAAFGASVLTDVLCGNGTEVGAGDTAMKGQK